MSSKNSVNLEYKRQEALKWLYNNQDETIDVVRKEIGEYYDIFCLEGIIEIFEINKDGKHFKIRKTNDTERTY